MIYIFAPNGRVIETHPLPCDRPTNCTFGDADLRTLYVTSIEGHLLRARTERQGLLHYPLVNGTKAATVTPGIGS
jgi:gluconolactonase